MTDTEILNRLRKAEAERDEARSTIVACQKEFHQRDMDATDLRQAVGDIIAAHRTHLLGRHEAEKERNNAEEQCAYWQRAANEESLMLDRFRRALGAVLSLPPGTARDEAVFEAQAVCGEYDASITYEAPATPNAKPQEGDKS